VVYKKEWFQEGYVYGDVLHHSHIRINIQL
jgi:hypothetical protein